MFARHGSNIAIIDLNKKEGNAVIFDTEKKFKISGLFIPCDVSDFEKVKYASNNIISKFNKVDNIICAAGYGPKAAIEELEIEIWKRAVDINLNGTFYIIYSLIYQMLSQKKGNIIIIGSATIMTGSGGGVHYAATKASQYGIMKGLSYELLQKGIRTNIITPHIIDTPLLRKRYPDTQEVNAKLAKRIPLGRIGKPLDIANIALFLASEEAEYICGQEIIADGGSVYYRHDK
ncbi:MAG: SDR family oxidoreductase [Actinobacteria bacterium]|nr:SDR family oxidoreductase [Actinomycetota bacterium]